MINQQFLSYTEIELENPQVVIVFIQKKYLINYSREKLRRDQWVSLDFHKIIFEYISFIGYMRQLKSFSVIQRLARACGIDGGEGTNESFLMKIFKIDVHFQDLLFRCTTIEVQSKNVELSKNTSRKFLNIITISTINKINRYLSAL